MKFSVVIGLVGEKRAGKRTFVDLFLRVMDRKIWSPSHAHYEFSEPLGRTLEDLGLPKTRPNYQKLSKTLKKNFGGDTVMKGVQLLLENEMADLIFADGVRWPADEKLIRDFANNFLVYITASQQTRYQRTLISSNSKVGEKMTTWEEFLETEKAETELQIPDIGSRADFKISNDGTSEEYEKKVKEFYEKLVQPMIANKQKNPS